MGKFTETITGVLTEDTTLTAKEPETKEYGSYILATYKKVDGKANISHLDTYSSIIYKIELFSDTTVETTYKIIFNPSTSSNNYVTSMFNGSDIVRIDFRHFDLQYADTAKITNIGFFCANCANLDTVIGFETLNLEDVTYMFKMFYNCKKLIGTMTMPKPPTKAFKKAIDYVNSTYDENWNLKDIVYVDERKQLTMNYMFAETGIKSFVFDEDWAETKVYCNMGYFFNNDTNLTSVTNIPSGYAHLYSYMFAGCTALTSIDIGAIMPEKMNYMFDACSSLQEINGTIFIDKFDKLPLVTSTYYDLPDKDTEYTHYYDGRKSNHYYIYDENSAATAWDACADFTATYETLNNHNAYFVFSNCPTLKKYPLLTGYYDCKRATTKDSSLWDQAVTLNTSTISLMLFINNSNELCNTLGMTSAQVALYKDQHINN